MLVGPGLGLVFCAWRWCGEHCQPFAVVSHAAGRFAELPHAEADSQSVGQGRGLRFLGRVFSPVLGCTVQASMAEPSEQLAGLSYGAYGAVSRKLRV